MCACHPDVGGHVNIHERSQKLFALFFGGMHVQFFPAHIVEGNLETKLPTIWTDGKALQLRRSSDVEKIRKG